MTKLTIGRMAKLYGLHRSTLHEATAKGRVTAGHDGKGQRVIDLSEMIRVYGEPPGRPTLLPYTPTPEASTRPTPADAPPDTPTGWAEMIAELRLLREEVAGLRQELRLIEHKPDTPAPAPGTSPGVALDQPSAARQTHVATGNRQQEHSQSVSSFADLLSSFE